MSEVVGWAEVEEIAECDRGIRATQAKQAAAIACLYDKRVEFGQTRKALRVEGARLRCR